MFIFIPTTQIFSQTAFDKKNLDHIYNPNSKVQLEQKTYFKNDSATTFFVVHLNVSDSQRFEKEARLYMNFLEGFGAELAYDRDTLTIKDVLIRQIDRKYYCKYSYPIHEDLVLLELMVAFDRFYSFGIALNKEDQYAYSGILPYDSDQSHPFLKSFIHPEKGISLLDQKLNANSFWIYYYDTDFDVSVPPMIVDNDKITRQLNVSNQYQLPVDSLVSFSQPGLYFVQKDTSTLDGYALRVENEPFPVPGKYETLIQPLKYISTREEYNDLINANNKKAAFEKFWINITGSKEVAKEKIKWFYDRVAEANHFFTGYKEGWKTDMGMIYIIYGPPDEVYQHKDYQEWLYEQNVKLPAVRFTFVKIKNVFDRNHFSLVRDKKFDKHWFRAIEIWRNKE